MSVLKIRTLAGFVLSFILIGVGIFGYFTHAGNWGWWLVFGALAFTAVS